MQGALIPRLRRRFPNFDLRHAAVSDRDGRAVCSVNTRFLLHYRDGASLLDIDRDGGAPGAETIETVELAAALRTAQDFIPVKMDIEGAEYDLLDHVRDQPGSPLIVHLLVEFHERFVGAVRHAPVVERLKTAGLSYAERRRAPAATSPPVDIPARPAKTPSRPAPFPAPPRRTERTP